MVKYGPVARFARGLGFATAPNVEPTLNLAAVVASTPEQQRIRIVGGTEIEDRLSLRGLSVHRIHDREPGAGSHVLLEEAHHPGVCRVTYLFVRGEIPREPLRSTHPVEERDPQFLIHVATAKQDSPGKGMKMFGRRRLTRCRT